MKISFVLFAVSITFSCHSSSPVSPEPITPGEYKGSFAFTEFVGTDSVRTTTTDVFFFFTDSSWYSCKGAFPRGGGTYQIGPDRLVLRDLMARIALFDWTLVLNGSFFLERQANALALIQEDRQHHRIRRITLAVPAQWPHNHSGDAIYRFRH